MTDVAPRRELRALTSMRGLAAMAVVAQHFSATAQSYCLETIPSLVPHGYVGVDFFFVLSGFIMAYTYAGDFGRRGWRAYGPFLAKRVARVVPLNVVVLLLLFAAGTWGPRLLGVDSLLPPGAGVADLVANLFMLQGVGVGLNLNGPSWSISTEFAAYFLFPAFVAAVMGPRAITWGVVLVAAGVLLRIASQQARWGMGVDGPPDSVLRCFAEFAWGMAAWRVYRDPALQALFASDIAAVALAGGVAVALAVRFDPAAVVLLPFLVVAFASNAGRAGRFMGHGVFHFLGVISYSLYLIHNPFRSLDLYLLKMVASAPVGPVAAVAFAAAGSLAVIPFAWLAYVAVERPGRELVRRMFGVFTPAPPPATIGLV